MEWTVVDIALGEGTGEGDTRENPCPGMQTPGRCETRSIVSSGESAGN
jgi:hypothetical protein